MCVRFLVNDIMLAEWNGMEGGGRRSRRSGITFQLKTEWIKDKSYAPIKKWMKQKVRFKGWKKGKEKGG